MFLSKLILNQRDPQVRSELARPYEMHRTLWNRFPSLRKSEETGENLDRILFRVDTDPLGDPFVLVQSALEPDWTSLPAGYRAEPIKAFEPSFAIGQRLRFRLRANPTRKVGSASKSERLDGVKKCGKRIALVREMDQVSWLLDKGRTKEVEGRIHGGFTILAQHDAVRDASPGGFRVDVVPEGWVRCGKQGHEGGEFFAVRFDGILEVTHPVAFRNTLTAGLGSAKGFGFGLLSIACPEVAPNSMLSG